MNKDVKREIIAKFKKEMQVTQFKTDPPGIKQVDINQNKDYSKKKRRENSIHEINKST